MSGKPALPKLEVMTYPKRNQACHTEINDDKSEISITSKYSMHSINI